jgi:isoquinoline 1-oxidoreductase beta subunit
VFVTESFIDELAAAAKQDPASYRLALLDKNPRAKAVLALAAEKAGWGQSERVGRGVSLQFVFATYMAQVAAVEVAKDGAVRVRRVVCVVDCGTVVIGHRVWRVSPNGKDAKCGYECHSTVAAKDYIFTAYPKR